MRRVADFGLRRANFGADLRHGFMQVAHPSRELAQFVNGRGELVGLPIEQQLQAVFGLAQKAVGVRQNVHLVPGQAPGDFERFETQQRVALPHRWQVAAVEQLQELHRVFDVPNPAAPRLHVEFVGPGLRRALLHPALQRLHFVDLGEAEILAVNERLDRPVELAAQRHVPRNRAEFDERLPFPGSPLYVVIRQGAGHRTRQRPACAVRTQPQIDPVGNAAIRVVRQQPDYLGDDPREVVRVGNRPRLLPRGFAVLVVQEHEVDVARIVQLVAAEFPERERDELGGLAAANHRLAVLLAGATQCGLHGDFDTGIRDAGQFAGDFFERSIPQHIVHADAQHLQVPEPPKRPQHARIVVHRIDIGFQLMNQFRRGRRRLRGGVNDLKRFGISHQRVRKKLRRGEQLQ